MGPDKRGVKGLRTMVWFRKGLRLHDNPALLEAATVGSPSAMFPVFVLDPHFLKPANVGVNRYNFLLESLRDLDASLRARGSRLVVLRGKPEEELPKAWKAWGVSKITFEKDTEPYARVRDSAIQALAKEAGVEVRSFCSHTLWDPVAFNSSSSSGGASSSSSSSSYLPPLTYQAFLKQAHAKLGAPAPPLAANVPDSLPPAPGEKQKGEEEEEEKERLPGPCPVPEFADLPAYAGHSPSSHFHGGESVGLARLAAALSDDAAVAKFEKPKTDPTTLLTPSTTVLSPYLKFGCVSAREVHARVQESLSRARKKGLKLTEPPVSLEGQLLWREFYYCVAAGVGPSYYGYDGNPICRRIPWHDDRALLEAWAEARTGFPWIDAAMTQLRVEGWIHHLARHAVACFLTRGDLFQPWTAGMRVFDRLLLDSDPALNAGNWMWLSCSAFFHQYFRVYSPVSFAQKYDKSGAYIRRWVPALAKMPDKFIYSPWEAPESVQRAAGCVVGRDYPLPIVDHAVASKDCMRRMGEAFAASKESGGGGSGSGSKRLGAEAAAGSGKKKSKK